MASPCSTAEKGRYNVWGSEIFHLTVVTIKCTQYFVPAAQLSSGKLAPDHFMSSENLCSETSRFCLLC